MMGAKDGDIYYLTDMDEGMGDLYCNEELIDSDVMIGTLELRKNRNIQSIRQTTILPRI